MTNIQIVLTIFTILVTAILGLFAYWLYLDKKMDKYIKDNSDVDEGIDN